MDHDDVSQRIEEFAKRRRGAELEHVRPGQSPTPAATAAGLERLIDAAREMDGESYDVEMEEGRDCLMCEGAGHVFVGNWAHRHSETCPHCHGRGWLKARSFEPQPLFSVREMQWGLGSAFGVRHDESGFWHPWRLATRERAQVVADDLTLAWCEGEEQILVENFAALEDEEE